VENMSAAGIISKKIEFTVRGASQLNRDTMGVTRFSKGILH